MPFELKLDLNAPLVPQFQKIPADADAIYSSYIDFRQSVDTDFKAAFATLGPKIQIITLSNAFLGLDKKFGTSFLLQVLAGISAHVKRLNLYGNSLKNLYLEEIFAAFPASVTGVDLRDNQLGMMLIAQLVKAIKAYPPNIPLLNLSANKLSALGDDLAQAFAAIPPTVTSLGIADNELRRISTDGLVSAFAAIPANVTSINLSGNSLSSKPTADLVRIFQAIPSTVTSLNLHNNGLGAKPVAELIQILKAIPSSVTSLDLSSNELEKLSTADLALFFAAIPANITSLNLSGNKFDAYKINELAAAFGSFPSTLTSLTMRFCQFPHYARSVASVDADLTKVLCAIPKTVTSLDIKHSVSEALEKKILEARKAPESGAEKSIVSAMKISGSPLHRAQAAVPEKNPLEESGLKQEFSSFKI